MKCFIHVLINEMFSVELKSHDQELEGLRIFYFDLYFAHAQIGLGKVDSASLQDLNETILEMAKSAGMC